MLALTLGACTLQDYTPVALDQGLVPAQVAGARLDEAASAQELTRLGAIATWPPPTWTPAQLGLLAAMRSRQVSAARAAVTTAIAGRGVADQRANPVFGLTLEHHSCDQGGADPNWSIGPSLNYTWSPISRRRPDRAYSTESGRYHRADRGSLQHSAPWRATPAGGDGQYQWA